MALSAVREIEVLTGAEIDGGRAARGHDVLPFRPFLKEHGDGAHVLIGEIVQALVDDFGHRPEGDPHRLISP